MPTFLGARNKNLELRRWEMEEVKDAEEHIIRTLGRIQVLEDDGFLKISTKNSTVEKSLLFLLLRRSTQLES